MITAITATGGRSEAFELCQKMIKAQTVKPDQWIVVHDGITKAQVPELQKQYPELELYAGPRIGRLGLNTQRFNFEEALKHIRGDFIFFFEDDDFYRPEYIQEMLKLLQTAELAGLANNKYYNLALPGSRELGNFKHSSLCSTAMRKSMLPILQEAVDSGDMYFDIQLWNNPKTRERTTSLLNNSSLVIGMKNMPGRPGISGGHKVGGYSIDSNLVKLKEWVGEEWADIYKAFIPKYFESKTVPNSKPPQLINQKPKVPVINKTYKAPQKAPTQALQAKVMPSVVPELKPQAVKAPLPNAASTNQKKAMALMPQGNNQDSMAEIKQTQPSYPVGERSQTDIFPK